jgi:multiple sugar transport system permease protein
MSRTGHATPLPYLLILPACLGVLLVDIYPFISAFALAFQRRILGQPIDPFIGLANFQTVLRDPDFWSSLWITVIWTVASVGAQLLVGTSLALLVHGLRIGQRFFTSLLLLPWVTPVVVAALTWRWMLNADYGVVNAYLPITWLGFDAGHDWLGEGNTVLAAVVAAHVWKYYGFIMLVSLARLKTIPAELNEAARLDGCGRWGLFRHVTAPQLWEVLSVTVLLMCIWTFNTFDVVYLMAGEHPSANVLSIEIWRHFYGSFNYGLAAATAVLMFVALFGLAVVYLRRARP